MVRLPSESRTLLIPYCELCFRRISSQGTRQVSLTLASLLLAVSVAVGSPLAFQWLSPWWHLVSSVVAGSMPWLAHGVVLIIGSRPLWREPAVWWLKDGRLACVSHRWARQLAQLNDAQSLPIGLRVPGGIPHHAWVGSMAALVLAPALNAILYPSVRLINVTSQEIVIEVDGRAVAELEPTRTENPSAGIEMRLPAGHRKLAAKARDGRILSSAAVTVRVGERHLYAPSSEGYCFWTEENRYGKSTQEAQLQVLTGSTRFWVLPETIDTWFRPNPHRGADQRSTGGRLVALRLAPCTIAPDPVRQASQ